MTSPSVLQAAILAVVQGITEFLPISSSAHLILASWALGWQDQGLAFDIATHVGSWIALVWCTRGQLADELAAWRRGESQLLVPVTIGSIPVVVVGVMVADWVATGARSPVLIATTTIAFGLLLAVADRSARRHDPTRERVVGLRDAAIIGLAQAIALVPGVSRSGITITAALLLGFSRVDAAKFSFLLAIPLGAAVGIKDGIDLVRSPVPVDWGILLEATAIAALSAWVVIRLFLAWIETRTMTVFVLYRLGLGALIFAIWFARS
jgi:undecaprenyl-diphosphatase